MSYTLLAQLEILKLKYGQTNTVESKYLFEFNNIAVEKNMKNNIRVSLKASPEYIAKLGYKSKNQALVLLRKLILYKYINVQAKISLLTIPILN